MNIYEVSVCYFLGIPCYPNHDTSLGTKILTASMLADYESNLSLDVILLFMGSSTKVLLCIPNA